MKRLLALAIFLTGLAIPIASIADKAISDVTTSDATEIHAVVQSQLDALARDDAARAFELASPSTRMLLGSADNFLRMIKELYDPFYRHRHAFFSEPEILHGMTIQIVRITDRASQVWLAVFWMQKEENDAWRIDGCELMETGSVSI